MTKQTQCSDDPNTGAEIKRGGQELRKDASRKNPVFSEIRQRQERCPQEKKPPRVRAISSGTDVGLKNPYSSRQYGVKGPTVPCGVWYAGSPTTNLHAKPEANGPLRGLVPRPIKPSEEKLQQQESSKRSGDGQESTSDAVVGSGDRERKDERLVALEA